MELKNKINFHSIKINCERVLLSPITLESSEDIFREFTNEITRYMFPSSPSEISQITSYIEMCTEGMNNKTDLVLEITDLITGEFLGVCALHEKENPKEPELGVWLKRDAHNNQYGREAIYHLVEWARDNLKLNYLVYPVDKDNMPSIKIAESLGGKIFRTDIKKSMSGNVLNEVAYKIT